MYVDDFGVKYYSKADADHLINALAQDYKLTVDWTGSDFCGLNFDWNYDNKFVDVSMPKYLDNVLACFNHKIPHKPQYSPHPFQPVIYTKKGHQQLAPKPSNAPLLTKKDITYVQSVVGSLLYYTRALDGTLLTALNEIGTQQAKPTLETMLSYAIMQVK
mmetsp:Transcript_16468/g.23423  ORF Transcript_16468/g.23423 Transcript_16468/m.23423 type:complete len:160 (-) Transcript_16468:159-638(-)